MIGGVGDQLSDDEYVIDFDEKKSHKLDGYCDFNKIPI